MKKKPIIFLILILLICSLFMPLTVNYTGQSKIFNSSRLNRYTSLTRLENISNQYITSYKQNVGFELKNDLGLVEGIKNGVVVFGNYFRNIITGTILDYKNGFNNVSGDMKIVWIFFGLFVEIAKNILFSSLELVAIILILLSQATSSYNYILSYLLTILFIIGIKYVFKKK